MASKETTKDTTIPMRRRRISKGVAAIPLIINFSTLRSEAPSITGIAIKNENSLAAVLDTLKRSPPRMVEPDLDVPGMREKIWNEPIQRASR